MYVELLIENKLIKMEVDTGAGITAISEFDKERYFPSLKIEKSDLKLTSYGDTKLELLGVSKNLM